MLKFCTLSVRGCWGQPILLFWKLVYKTQISIPPKPTRHVNWIKLWILLSLRADLLYILQYETPCRYSIPFEFFTCKELRTLSKRKYIFFWVHWLFGEFFALCDYFIMCDFWFLEILLPCAIITSCSFIWYSRVSLYIKIKGWVSYLLFYFTILRTDISNSRV